MFQAWLVKIAKIAASSSPITLPGNRFMKNTTVKVRNPRIGTDCRMSSTGISTSAGPPALRRGGAVGEGEQQRGRQRGEHAQRGAHRVFRQVDGVEADLRRRPGVIGAKVPRATSVTPTSAPNTHRMATASHTLGKRRPVASAGWIVADILLRRGGVAGVRAL